MAAAGVRGIGAKYPADSCNGKHLPWKPPKPQELTSSTDIPLLLDLRDALTQATLRPVPSLMIPSHRLASLASQAKPTLAASQQADPRGKPSQACRRGGLAWLVDHAEAI
jgi:hypothetical protein